MNERPNNPQDAEAEPTVRRSGFPVLVLAALSVVLYWGGMYVIDFGGDADARVHYPYRSFKQIDDYQPKDADAMAAAKGALVYSRICLACHQADGNGSRSQNAPPLAGSEWVAPKDPSRIIRIVLHGLSGPIKVKGEDWGTGQMLAWKETLTDEDIAHVLTFVRNSWGNKALAVKPEQVAKIRKETAGHQSYMTVPDLEKVVLLGTP
ncbi:MAG TPA: cytochrome c [Verrucomicrobiae bacterium]|nr:cytochrome c [Verrucomicrobiae bacterium]